MSADRHIHVFIDTVVPPTCQEQGYTQHRCACGYEHKDNFIPLGNHKFDVVEEIMPTCVDNGGRTLRCSVCSKTVTQESRPLGHTWGDWQTQTFPTCTAEGTAVHVCTRCGHIEEQTVPPIGHDLTSPNKSETQKGYVEYFCKNCGETVVMPSKSKRFFGIHKKVIIAVSVSLVLAVCLLFATLHLFIPAYHYNRALEFLEDGAIEEAYDSLKACKGYKDSNKLLKNFKYVYKKYTEVYYNEDGSTTTNTTERKYNELGNLLSVTYYDNDGNLTDTAEYKYNEKGQCIFVAEYDADSNMTSRYEYEYTSQGKRAINTVFDESGNTRYTYEIEYNGNDQMTFYTVTDANGFIYKSKYEYDQHGNQTLYGRFDKNGVLVPEYTYVNEYDEDGNWIRRTRYDTNGAVVYSGEFESDKDGNIIKAIWRDETDYIYQKISYKYDEFGYQTTATQCNVDNEIEHEWVNSDPVLVYSPKD